jgi:hypothetical protein
MPARERRTGPVTSPAKPVTHPATGHHRPGNDHFIGFEGSGMSKRHHLSLGDFAQGRADLRAKEEGAGNDAKTRPRLKM